MKPELQRIAIAKACSWIDLWDENQLFHPSGYKPGETVRYKLPDYLNDLNAMAEAEKMLTEEQFDEYIDALTDVLECGYSWRSMGLTDCRSMLSATAAQRAKALLLTIGKWEEDVKKDA